MIITPDINKILKATPRPARFGAPMGARDVTDGGLENLYLQRVRMVDGDYASDGTYWGGGRDTPALWCAFSACGQTRIYIRADSRAEAAELLQEEHEGATLRHRTWPRKAA